MSACNCYGCSFVPGACERTTCSECGEVSAVELETRDVRDGEFGLTAYRPCAECAS